MGDQDPKEERMAKWGGSSGVEWAGRPTKSNRDGKGSEATFFRKKSAKKMVKEKWVQERHCRGFLSGNSDVESLLS